MDEIFSYIPFVLALLVFKIYVLSVDSYDLQCPSQPNWKLRAKVKCNSTSSYFCLFNKVNGNYVEGCNGPDWDRKGSKRIYIGDFSRGICVKKRFQPFKFWTNESMSDCIYVKSNCKEEGQIVYKDDSTKNDSRCRCDYKKNYSFIDTPRNGCYCIPTEEDCSCYIKACPVNLILSGDYECTSSTNQEKPKCKDITSYSEPKDDKTRDQMKKDHLWENKKPSDRRWNDTTAAAILFCLCFIHIFGTGGLLFAVLFHKWTGEKLQPLKRCFKKNHKVDDDHCEVENDQEGGEHQQNHILTCVELTPDERMFLRVIHLLFRVACPVVRMIFNHEIQPNQLRKTLFINKTGMEKQFRKKEKIINNFQWDLLYNTKGKTVSSEEFDIRLMIYLLQTLANIKIGELYPVSTDRSIGAMLTRIKYIRNETIQRLEVKLKEDQYNQYWDDIGQAVLKLVSSHRVDIENITEKKLLIERLQTINPINFDNEKIRMFIFMSETYPSMIIRECIAEFCASKDTTIKDVLREEKHQLYHKRQRTENCCLCKHNLATYMKVFTEEQWEALYELTDDRVCPCTVTICSGSFVPKTDFKLDSCDFSLVVSLVLYIPRLLEHFICVNGFDKFLMNNQHTLYHSMEKSRCCKCDEQLLTEKTMISKKEWRELFVSSHDISCKNSVDNCCCKHTVKKEINYSELDEHLRFKIGYVAGPISVLNDIGQDTFYHFLNWTENDKTLQEAITELSNMIKDKTLCKNMSHKTETQSINPRKWISRHLRQHKSTTQPPLEILLSDKDDLNVKSVHIPKDFKLPQRTKTFTDFTTEENNFLVVVYGLTKIVYPVIHYEFSTQCPDHVLNEIRICISEQQNASYCKGSSKDENKSQKERMYLTKDQQRQLFSQTKEESKNFDLEFMIYILKKRSNCEWIKSYVEQLDVIDKIRREIVESNSGTLDQIKFEDILIRISEAVLRLGGEKYRDDLSKLHHIKIF